MRRAVWLVCVLGLLAGCLAGCAAGAADGGSLPDEPLPSATRATAKPRNDAPKLTEAQHVARMRRALLTPADVRGYAVPAGPAHDEGPERFRPGWPCQAEHVTDGRVRSLVRREWSAKGAEHSVFVDVVRYTDTAADAIFDLRHYLGRCTDYSIGPELPSIHVVGAMPVPQVPPATDAFGWCERIKQARLVACSAVVSYRDLLAVVTRSGSDLKEEQAALQVLAARAIARLAAA